MNNKKFTFMQGKVAARALLFALLGLLSADVFAQAPPAPTFPTMPSANQRTANQPSSTRTLRKLNFREAPLDIVLQYYSELTGRTMINAPGISATVTLRSQTKLTREEEKIAITSALGMQNIVLEPMGEKFFRVIQKPTGIGKDNLKPAKPEDFAETDALVTQLIVFEHIPVSEAQTVVQGLVGTTGKILVIERLNGLRLTDTSANVKRVLQMVALIDKPSTSRVETRVYELKYATSSDVSSRLNELIQQSQSSSSSSRSRTSSTRSTRASSRSSSRRTSSAVTSLRPGNSNSATTVTAESTAEQGVVQGEVKIVADERTNIMIVISEPQNFEFFDKIVAVLDAKVEPSIIVKVLLLEFADAEEISGVLNEFIGAASSKSSSSSSNNNNSNRNNSTASNSRSRALNDYMRSSASNRTSTNSNGLNEDGSFGQIDENTKILPDTRTNSILLMGRKADLVVLEDLVDQLDIMLAQVLIEATILEVRLGDNLEYGVEWLQRAMTLYDNGTSGPAGEISTGEATVSWAGGSRSGDTNFQDASELTDRDITLNAAGATYYATFFDLNLDAILHLSKTESNISIVQTPVIVTTDNTEAKIIIGEERPIVTSTTGSTLDSSTTTSRYEYKSIGVEINVTPRISPERTVVMDIKQSADNVAGYTEIDGNQVPVITKREMEAQVAVRHRSTIALGGLVSKENSTSVTKIPILGDIPLLGALFRSTSEEEIRTELLVLLTPYVMVTPEEAREESARLKNSSAVGDAPWVEGWSESPLATPEWDGQVEQKNEERRERDRMKREELAKERAMRDAAWRQPEAAKSNVEITIIPFKETTVTAPATEFAPVTEISEPVTADLPVTFN